MDRELCSLHTAQHAPGTLLTCKEWLADAHLCTHQDRCSLLCPLRMQKHRPSPCPSLANTARFPAAWHGRGLPAPLPAPQHSQSSSGPGLRTVKMLERRLDCLRMGVGVLEAAMVSIRSSRWLMLGVEGTEEE